MPSRFSQYIGCALALSPLGAMAADIPYGVEAVAQYRSEYNYRGFQLANDTIDVQLSSHYAFNDTTYLNAATWFGSETGDGDFTEAGLLADLRKDLDSFTLSLSGTYRSYSNSFFESGVNFEAAAIYHLNESFDLSSRIAYDTGADGIYGNLELSYYYRINDDSFVNIGAGLSAVDRYYTRNGLNDGFGKISYTYNINQSVSVTPYAGTSVLLDSNDTGGDSLYGGIYFAVSF